MDHPFIYGERIYLRSITEEDIPNYMPWLDDQEVTRYMQRGIYPNNTSDMREYIQSLQRGKNGMNLAIIRKEEEKHIGNIALLNIHPIFRTADIAIIIGDKLSWGQGYATEAIKLLLNHAYTRMNLNRLEAGAVVKNIGSMKAFEKAGFKHEGIKRKAYYCEGEYQDVAIMSILKEDWRRSRLTDSQIIQ